MMALTFATGTCSLGSILVATTAKGISAILLGDDPNTLVADLQDGFPHAQLLRADETFTTVMDAAIDLVDHPSHPPALALDAHGTAFQQQVWQVLRTIPAGSTMTYAEVAGQIGAPGSARAVARACAIEHHRRRHPLPPRRAERSMVVGVSVGGGTEEGVAREGRRVLAVL